MTRQRNDKAFRWLAVLLAVFMLVSVRLMEKEWFPEALIDFFATDAYLTQPLPALGISDILTVFFRYAVNSVISVILLYLLFRDRELTLWSVKFYVWAGIFLIIAYVFLVRHYEAGHYRLLFYVRRMLIHPLFLFILIPAFYFLRTDKSSSAA